MEKDRRYRIVSDYGFGDKCWIERDLTEEEALKAINDQGGYDFETLEAALDYDYGIYSVEDDNLNDEEDWDWMDS